MFWYNTTLWEKLCALVRKESRRECVIEKQEIWFEFLASGCRVFDRWERLENLRAQTEKKIRHSDVCVRCAYKTSQSMLEVFLLFADAHTEKKNMGYISHTLHLCHLFGLQDSDSAHWITRRFSENIRILWILFCSHFINPKTCFPKSYGFMNFLCSLLKVWSWTNTLSVWHTDFLCLWADVEKIGQLILYLLL